MIDRLLCDSFMVIFIFESFNLRRHAYMEVVVFAVLAQLCPADQAASP
jgi:hypothetical protein